MTPVVWRCDACGVVSEPLPLDAADQRAAGHDHGEHGGEPTADLASADPCERDDAQMECPDPGQGANQTGAGSPSTTCKDSERSTSMLRLIEPPTTALPAPPAVAEVTHQTPPDKVLPPWTVELVRALVPARAGRRVVRSGDRSPAGLVAALVAGVAVSGAAGLALSGLLWPLVLSAAGVLAAVAVVAALLAAVTSARCPGAHCGGCGR
jgi:hypothetical protein